MGDRASYTTEVIGCPGCAVAMRSRLAPLGHGVSTGSVTEGMVVSGVFKASYPEGTALALYEAADGAAPCHDVRVVALLDDGRIALVTAKAGGGADLDWLAVPVDA